MYYKYVVDGVWTCGNDDNTETDENGNLNCVLNVPEKSTTVKTFVLPNSSPVSAKQTSPKKSSIFGSLKKKPTSDKVVEDKVDVIEPVVEPPSPEKSETHATLAIEEEPKPSIDKKAKRQSIFARTMTKKDRAEFEASLEGIRREEIKSEQQQAEEKPNDEEHLVQKKKSFWRKVFKNITITISFHSTFF